jgi:Putative viral replication protein.
MARSNSSQDKSRGWVFTVNNPTEWDEDELKKLVDYARYVIYGNEVGESGTPHWQGFALFNSQVRLRTCQGLLARAHWEIQRGTSKQAIDYCKKEGL